MENNHRPSNLKLEDIAMRYLAIIFIMPAVVCGALAQTMPCHAPSFVSESVKPNLLIALDNSGSMGDAAYWSKIYNGRDTLWLKSGTPPRYYGYFNNDSNYTVSGGVFESSTSGKWPGWLLNWAVMSRTDIMRKVLIGGKFSSNKLLPQNRGGWEKRYYRNASNYITFIITLSGGKTYLQITSNGPNPPITGTLSNTSVEVKAPLPFRGVIHQIADKDQDGKWDDNAPRFGLWLYNNGQGDKTLEGGGNKADNGGHISSYINEPTLTDMVNAIQNTNPTTWTPLAENHFEILHYFSQATPYFSNTNYTQQVGGVKDPYYDKNLKQMIWCAKSFVLLLTDGEPTQDRMIPDNDGTLPSCSGLQNYWNGENQPPITTGGSNGRAWLDDVALYGYTNDLRTDLDGDQSVSLYTVFCFGKGSGLLKEAAKCGSFIDRNGNKRPDLQSEWDIDGDNVPDGYFEAEDGWELEEAIMRAILAIVARAASGTAVSIVCGSSDGEGTVHQAYFQPALYQGSDELLWSGYLRALWIDRAGNLREDTHADGVMQMQDDGGGIHGDYVVQMHFDPATNETKARRYRDPNGKGNQANFVFVDEKGLGELADVWNGGKWLYNNSAASRNIKTFADADGNGIVGSGEIKALTTANAATLRDYMGAASTAQAETIIQYVRGVDYSNLRPRTLDGKVWKLGDIINSSPGYIGKPTERYDQIYGDASYAEFYQAHRYRRNLVVVGANDGMIHAFNAGRYVANLDPTSNNKGYVDPMGQTLGKEMWAYVPKNLLPHLRWLPKTNYCHVYFQDLKIKITDVQIFTPDALHRNGWGTIIIAGMRLGGYPITSGGSTYRSSYVCIDVTDPDNPAPLWEINAPDLGFTVSYPCVGRVGNEWYAVAGGGPTTFDGTSSRYPKVYIMNLRTGQLVRSIQTDEDSCAVGDCISVDINLNGQADVFYFGTYSSWGAAAGKMYRLVTCSTFYPGSENTDPNTWTLNTLINMGRPITAGPVAAKDEFNNFWVYFGTGRFFASADKVDPSAQYIVGIKDNKMDTTRTLAQLLNVSNIAVNGIDSVSYNGTSGPWINWRSFMTDISAYKGWYRVLPVSGDLAEKSLNKPVVIGGALLTSTFIPSDDPCALGGTGYLYALYYLTGTAYYDPILARGDPGTSGVGANDNPVKINLGAGQPSAPSIHIGATGERTFIQTPTGAVVSVGTVLPYSARSGNLFWKQP